MRTRLVALVLLAAACTTGGGSAPTTAPPTLPPLTTAPATPTPTTGAVTLVEAGPRSLLVWAPPEMVDSLRNAAAAYTADTGVEVQVDERSLDDIRAGIGGPDAPDVFFGRHRWIRELAADGILEPLTGLDPEGLATTALQAFSLRGALYGVPMAVETGALFRNTALTPQPVATTTGFTDACAGRPEGLPCIAVPTAAGEIHYPFLAAGGGYLFAYSDAEGFDLADLGLNSPGAVTGFEALEDMIDAGVMTLLPEEEALTAFVEGRAHFLITGPSQMYEVLDALENSTVAYAIDGPPGVGSDPSPALIDAVGLFATTSSSDKVAAVDLAVHLGSAGVPRAVPASASPAQGDLAALAAVAASGHPRPPLPEADLAFEALGEAVTMIYGGTDAAEALTEATRTLRNALEPAEDGEDA